jgi:segregation and condensation protein B
MDPENESPSDGPEDAGTSTPETAEPPVPSDQADGTSAPTVAEEAGGGEGAPAPAPAEEAPILPPQEIRAVLEALIFASPQPLTSREINSVMQGVPRSAWLEALAEIKADYARDGRGLNVVEVAGGYQITTRPEYNDWVRQLLDPKPTARLSIQALETLAVIAYKQPVTQPEVIELRGVKSGGVVKTLLEKRLIKIVGRKEVVGRPILYGTTKYFLLHFGLKDLSELPKIEEFAEVLGEEVDVEGLKKAIEAPRPVEIPLSDEETAASDAAAAEEGQPAESGEPAEGEAS